MVRVAHGEEIVAGVEGDAVRGDVCLVVGDLTLGIAAHRSDRRDELSIDVHLTGAGLVDVEDQWVLAE